MAPLVPDHFGFLLLLGLGGVPSGLVGLDIVVVMSVFLVTPCPVPSEWKIVTSPPLSTCLVFCLTNGGDVGATISKFRIGFEVAARQASFTSAVFTVF